MERFYQFEKTDEEGETLSKWYEKCKEIELAHFKKLVKMPERWKDGILIFFKYGITKLFHKE